MMDTCYRVLLSFLKMPQSKKGAAPPVENQKEKSVNPDSLVNHQNEDALKKEIEEVIKKKLWRTCKNFPSSHRLEKACNFVAKELGEEKLLKKFGMSVESFREKHQCSISKALALLRNRVRARMQKVVFRKWNTKV